MRIRAAIALLLLLASASPVRAAAGISRQAESPRFIHFASAPQPKRVRVRERFTERLEAKLGVRVSRRIEFFAYEGQQEVTRALGRPLAGFFAQDLAQVHAAPEAEEHELVHVVSYELGNPGLLFNEGLAVALGNEGRLGRQPVDRIARSILQRLDAETALELAGKGQSYEASCVAGSFVARLIKVHGLPKMAAFFRASGKRGKPVAFEATFGIDLRTAAADWGRSLGVKQPLESAAGRQVADGVGMGWTAAP